MFKLISVFFALLMSSQSFSAGTHFNKVLIIVFENTDFERALSQPYFKSLAQEGSLLKNYHAITHPSQSNYVALIAGSTLGVINNKPVNLNQKHIGDLLEAKGFSWKVYAEGYPGNCFLGAQDGFYVRKHVPFLSFTNVQNNPQRCALVTDTTSFETDFMQGNLANYSLYVPNLRSDGHDTGVSFGDQWLKKNFDHIFHSTQFPKDLLVVITFDEGSQTPDNKIYTLFLGASVQAGFSSLKRYDHFSLLKTIEKNFATGDLGQNDLTAVEIDDVWKK